MLRQAPSFTSRSDAFLSQLTSKSLEQKHLQGISTILSHLAGYFYASGCALWHPADNDSIFVLAEWFEGDHFMGIHDLPIDDSISGRAITSGQFESVESIEDSRTGLRRDILRDLGIQELGAIPIELDEGQLGALTLYRRDRRGWSEQDKTQLRNFAPLVSALYAALHNRVSSSVLQEANQLFRRFRSNMPQSANSRQAAKEALTDVVQLIQRTFSSLEVSVFLRDPDTDGAKVPLVATTWDRPGQNTRYTLRSRKGPTAWVLRNKKPIAIFDVPTTAAHARVLENKHRGLKFSKLERLFHLARGHEQMKPHKELPPLGFMAVPIMHGSEPYGVIRCFAPTQSPFFFSKKDVALLEILASLIADFWTSLLEQQRTEEEKQTWQSLISGLEELNRFTQEELARATDTPPAAMMRQALIITNRAIPSAEILDVRLVDSEKQELHFAATFGHTWQQGSEEEQSDRKNKRFPIGEDPPKSAGDWVMQNQRLYKVTSPKLDKIYSPTFNQATNVYVAPIIEGQWILGVLDLRTSNPKGFPKNADQAATLIGQQLGLCLGVTNAAQRLREAAQKLQQSLNEQQEHRRQEMQVYEDLSHQLRTPVQHGHERIRALLAHEVPKDKEDWNLRAIRGLSRKAVRVVSSMHIFADLAHRRSLKADLQPLDSNYLITLLIENAADTKLLAGPSNIHFKVKTRPFEDLEDQLPQFHADRNLLEQAIANILDNARKYSLQSTDVIISGGLTGGKRLYISVINVGLKIEGHHVKKLTQRLWRDPEAEEFTGEGAGIGLWIVEHIMKAHRGELEIIPTRDGKTEFRILFPKITRDIS